MPESGFIQTTITIRLTPGSSRNEILAGENNVYRARVTAPALEGRANKALIKLLSEKLDVPKGYVEIVSGKSSRLKVIRIRDLSPANIAMRLQ